MRKDREYQKRLREGTLPIISSNQEEIAKIEKELKKTIIGFYEPESTRWHRNYSDRAEWYFLWRKEFD